MLNKEKIEIKNIAPIIIPTLNRFQHFKECVESLRNCTHADKTDLIIGLDYPPSEKYVEGWNQIKEYIPTIKGFNKIIVFEHKENLGAVGNSNFLLDYVYKNYTTFIYTEDDNVFSPCFLDFINKGLIKYRNDSSVVAIGPYLQNELIKIPTHENTVVKIPGTFNAWGFGTWVDKYQELVVSIKPSYRLYILHNKRALWSCLKKPGRFNQFNTWLYDKPELDRPCDVTFSISNLINEKSQLFSAYPIVKNIGYDGSGDNCGTINDNNPANRKIVDWKTFDFIDFNVNKYLSRNFKLFAKDENNCFTWFRICIVRFEILGYIILGYEATINIEKKIELFFHKAKNFIKKILGKSK